MHSWMSDNGQTPHVVVDANAPDLEAPAGFARDGKLVLNISYPATNNLDIGNEELVFSARFSGVPYTVRVPVRAVLGIYARETGRGMIFSEEESDDSPDDAPQPPPAGDSGGGGRPKLKVVK